MYRVLTIISVLALLLSTAVAETLLTQEQALKIVFPKSESVNSETRVLTPEQRQTLEENTGLRFPEADYPTFVATTKGQTDGYAIILNEIGKHENITFIVGVSPKGKVMEVAIMEYRESRGDVPADDQPRMDRQQQGLRRRLQPKEPGGAVAHDDRQRRYVRRVAQLELRQPVQHDDGEP